MKRKRSFMIKSIEEVLGDFFFYESNICKTSDIYRNTEKFVIKALPRQIHFDSSYNDQLFCSFVEDMDERTGEEIVIICFYDS